MKRQIGLVREDGSDTPALALMGKRHRQAMLFGSPVDGLADYGVILHACMVKVHSEHRTECLLL